MALKISFIVPIYKVEKYLERCLDSIYSQMRSQDELVLVNDGSPDRCPEIAKSFADNKDNVIYISQDNGGLSSARNTGIKAATGDYVWFIDSDDFLDNINSKVYDIVSKEECEIYCLNTQVCDENGHILKKIERGLSAGEHSSLEIYKAFKYPFSAVQFYIFKRSIFEMFEFRTGIISEDWQFILRVLSYSKNSYVINASPYCYRVRTSGSITHSTKTSRYVRDNIAIVKDFYACLHEKGIDDEGRKILYSGICSIMCEIRKLIFQEIRDKEEKMKSIELFKTVKFWREALKQEGTWKQWIQYYMLLCARFLA